MVLLPSSFSATRCTTLLRRLEPLQSRSSTTNSPTSPCKGWRVRSRASGLTTEGAEEGTSAVIMVLLYHRLESCTQYLQYSPYTLSIYNRKHKKDCLANDLPKHLNNSNWHTILIYLQKYTTSYRHQHETHCTWPTASVLEWQSVVSCNTSPSPFFHTY